jgi:hypothetical protein
MPEGLRAYVALDIVEWHARVGRGTVGEDLPHEHSEGEDVRLGREGDLGEHFRLKRVNGGGYTARSQRTERGTIDDAAYREPLGWELLLLVGNELAGRLRQSEVAELGLKKGQMLGSTRET